MNPIRRANKLKTLAGELPLKRIAQKLNRTEAATRVQARKLGVSVNSAAGEGVGRTNKRPPRANAVEQVLAPAAIERALSIYQQLQERDPSVVAQARKILTQHIYGMVDHGECDEQRLTVGGLIHLKAIERDHAIKSARDAPNRATRHKARV